MLVLLISSVFAININADYSVTGQVNCVALDSDLIETDGTISIDSSLVAESISSTYISTESLVTSTITSPTGTITIQGNINLAPLTDSSFLQKTWKTAEINRFENSHENWSSPIRNSCAGNFVLGGHCKMTEVYKEFQLPQHKYVRISGILHILDLWKGEQIEIIADGKVVWSRRSHSHESGVNICGSEQNDPGYSTKFDVTLPHANKEILVVFRSNIDKEQCHASFALGEVGIFTRL